MVDEKPKDRRNDRRSHGADAREAAKLLVQATTGVTSVVEEMHRTIACGPAVLGRPLAVPARLFTALAYGHVRSLTRLVGSSIDAALEAITPLLGESTPGPQREAVVAVLNGVLGDYLAEIGSPFAIPMTLRIAHEHDRGSPGSRLPTKEGGSKLLVLVHGSSMSHLQWLQHGHDHGAALARDLGYSPIYVHYNSGLHISTNGAELSERLEELLAAWPAPASELVLLGHSMGGLVARSACHHAELFGRAWRSKLRAMVFLGSPHHGSPIERGGNWIDVLLGVSRYSAPLARLAKIRSAGVTDLRYGNVLDAHWEGRARFGLGPDRREELRLPEGVDCFAIAGTTAREDRPRLPGDGLVPVDSALGRHARPELTLRFPESHQYIAYGTSHVDLLSRPEVYERIRSWLA